MESGESESKMRTGARDVLGDLFAQGVHRRESLFCPQAPLEGQVDLDSIKVTIEIEDMGFGHEVTTVVEGRSKSHVRDHGQRLPRQGRVTPQTAKMAEIDPGRREDLGLRGQIGRRESDRPPPTVALDDGTAGTERTTEEQRGLLDFTGRQQLADPGRVHVAPLDLDLRHDRDGEAQVRSPLRQQAHRAFSILAEMEVIPDEDLDGSNAFVDMIFDETLGTDLGEFLIEGFCHDRVETEPGHRLDLLLEGGEQSQLRTGLQHAAWMGLEGKENQLAVQGSGSRDDEFENRLVTEMHAIEIAEREHRTRERPIQFRNASKDLQALPSSARLIRVRILSHYFVARFLGLFSTVLLAALLLLATVELVLHLDDLSHFGSSAAPSLEASTPSDLPALADAPTPDSIGGIASAFRYLWVRLASYYLADLIPIASFLAVFITFAWAGRSMELVAIQAGGIRLRRVVFPVLVTTVILSLATALLHETVILRAHQIWAGETRGRQDLPEFGREAFWYHKGRTITNIAFADPETRMLHGVEIFERGPDGNIVRVVRVEDVEIGDDGVWHLRDAYIWHFDPQRATASPSLEENVSMDLDLDSLGGDVLLRADPGILSLNGLREHLASRSGQPSSSLRRLRERFHERLASPWLVFGFGCFALPFALRVDERGRLGRPAAAAVAMLGGFFLVQSAGTTLARQEVLPVGFTPWMMLAIVILGAALALRRRPL